MFRPIADKLALPLPRLAMIAVFVAGPSACAGAEVIISCDPIGDARPLCGFSNPEDIALLPGDRHAIVSEYGGMDGEKPGALALLDLDTEQRLVLYDGSTETGRYDLERWGSADCPGPPSAFSPHGLYLSERDDRQLQLLVVQHAGRESVEYFEVRQGTERASLEWRGCVVAPDGAMLNDVVAGPDGGFFVTHMMPRGNAIRQALNFARASLGGAAVGHVLRWGSEGGFRIVPGTEGPVPNGIERSKDGTRLFINYSGRGEIRRVEHRTGRIEAQASFEPLDNVTWTPDGRLLVAAARAGAAEMMACTSLESGQCATPFAILAVDADTLRAEEIYVGGPTTPSGAGTVGTMLRDGTLLVGTFAGDRVVRVAPIASVRTK